MSSTARAVILFAVLATFGYYIYAVVPDCVTFHNDCFVLQQQIVNHTADSPYRYRILAPLLVQPLVFQPTDMGVILAYAAFHLIAFSLLYIGLFKWLRKWMHENRAMIGVLALAAVFPLVFRHYRLSAWATLEVDLLLGALLFADSFPAVVLLTILASLNRETGLLIVGAYAACSIGQWHSRRYWMRVGVLAGLWAVITAGLHIALGSAPQILSLQETFQTNTAALPDAIISNLMLAPLWFLAARNYRQSPAQFKALVWVGIAYLIAVLIGGLWHEIRLLLPLFPLLLPVILSYNKVGVTQQLEAAK